MKNAEKRTSFAAQWLWCCFVPSAAAAAALCAALCMCLSGTALRLGVCLAMAAVLLLVLLLNLRYIRRLSARAASLSADIAGVCSGSYGRQAQKKCSDELGDVCDGVNALSSELSRSESLQAEFISSVSHELRTPLTAITGWSETMQYDDAIQGESRRGIAIIAKEAGRLTRMVEGMLEFTRIQGGRFNLNIEPLDVAAELEDVIFAYGRPLKSEGIDISYSPPEDECMIGGDPERLRQVFWNIIDNAAKYGRDGKKIEISAGCDGSDAVVIFRDHGPGIPESELPHVTERFYKGSSRERGSGIGLAVCDEIVSRHGGTLKIENAPGGGALVTVRLALLPDADKN